MNNLFPVFYLGSIAYYAELIKHETVVFEQFENFPKQTYRNRCEIVGANGIQKLLIPVLKAGSKQLMKNVKISETEDWQKIHWKSLEASYRASPYFEYYEDEFRSYYHKKYASLLEFNLELHKAIIQLLQVNSTFTLSEKYNPIDEKDYRRFFNSKKESLNTKLKENTYIQVFTDRMPFQPNLSIVDLLFNEGPNSLEYLSRITSV
ncbi:MAG: WbqC family protein [Flavobacteriales bacterium]|nr:WbqC family protein [Flavobacteriales bacterium]